MRRRGPVASPHGLDGTSDHLCWGYDSLEDRRRATVTWLRDGLASGQHAWYVADGSREDLIADLAELPDRDALLASGMLRVGVAADVYGTEAVSAAAQLQVYDAQASAVLAAGGTGLRVAADVTSLVVDPDRCRGHLVWEHVSDRYAARRPFSAMCMFDTTVVPERASQALVCLHPLHRDGEHAADLTAYVDDDGRLALVGEVDGLSVGTLQLVLDAVIHDDDAVIDISEVQFVDGRAAAVISAELARRRAAGQDLVLAGACGLVRRVWALCGFDEELLAP